MLVEPHRNNSPVGQPAQDLPNARTVHVSPVRPPVDNSPVKPPVQDLPGGQSVHGSLDGLLSCHSSPNLQTLVHSSPRIQPQIHSSPIADTQGDSSLNVHTQVDVSPNVQTQVHISPNFQHHGFPHDQQLIHGTSGHLSFPDLTRLTHDPPLVGPSSVHDSPPSQRTLHNSPGGHRTIVNPPMHDLQLGQGVHSSFSGHNFSLGQHLDSMMSDQEPQIGHSLGLDPRLGHPSGHPLPGSSGYSYTAYSVDPAAANTDFHKAYLIQDQKVIITICRTSYCT